MLAVTPDILINTLLTATSLAVACALLSVIVVLRRWAFIGEGISHSGFGGAGTAWLLMLFIPALDQPETPFLAAAIFCLATAMAIGAISRRLGVNTDAAIGIFMVASLAWGFLARQIYLDQRNGIAPPLFDALLFGQVISLSWEYTKIAGGVSLAVVVIVIGLWKEIIAYAFDPALAETSGVRTRFIHYLLMAMVAMLIVVGMRIAGSVLVTALLVLPGATALLLTHRLGGVIAVSIIVALVGVAGGLLSNLTWRFIPAGPMIVLVMFVEFIIAYLTAPLRRRSVA